MAETGAETDRPGASEFERALDRIEYVLAIPAIYTSTLLRLDPIYDPLSDQPCFQALLERYSDN